MRNYTAWIVHNGFVTHEKFTTLLQHIYKAMVKKNIQCEMVKHHEIIIVNENGQKKIIGKYKDKKPDFIIFWDKDILLAQQLESLNIPLYNSARTIEICDNKALMHTYLSKFPIPMPKTIVAPHVFLNCKFHDKSFFDIVIQELGLPLIIKESYGSFGFQVYMAKTREQVIQIGKELQHKSHIYQQYIRSSHGQDIRLQVVGEQVIAAMYRKSVTDFKANITNGGMPSPYTPTEEEKQLAILASKTVGADFAGVDLLFGENGVPILCEINTNAHFINLMNCTKIDTAPFIIDYILQDMETK